MPRPGRPGSASSTRLGVFAYSSGIGIALGIFALIAETPLGIVWNAASAIGAIALFAFPYLRNARLRSVVVAVAAFVILLHAEEWVRGAPGFVGLGVAVLWITSLVGLVITATADATVRPTTIVNG